MTKSVLESISESGFCSGCGVCAGVIGPTVITMKPSPRGYLRPVLRSELSAVDNTMVASICPGIRIGLQADAVAYVDDVWGPVVKLRSGHAVDPELRQQGSSGGAVSALSLHLIESGQVDFVAQIAVSKNDPLRNEVQCSTSKADVLRAAGSRYAPAAPLERLGEFLATGKRFAVVGKPCDIAAVRNLARVDSRIDRQIPFLISFMCAGVPSMEGTHELVRALGMQGDELQSFRYRGDGWPGMARAVSRDGRVAEMDYARSWGTILNRHLQFRCKICPDGTGELADVVCADAWYGKDGYPDFAEQDGRSLVIARTARGEALVTEAMGAGVIAAANLDISEIARMQPYQLARKRLVLARLLGTRLRLGWMPKFRGLRLLRCALRASPLEWLRNAVGTYRRAVGEVVR